VIACGLSLRARLFYAFALITVIAAALPALTFHNTLRQERLALAEQEAARQISFVSHMLENPGDAFQVEKIFDAARGEDWRLTLVDAQGRVIHDSQVPPAEVPRMDNHADRPEIEAAMNRGRGVSVRHSNTLGPDMVYVAVSLRNGQALRAAVPMGSLRQGLEKTFSSVSFSILCVSLFCLLLSFFIASRVRRGMEDMTAAVCSIAGARPHLRLRQVPGGEFLPLARAVNLMADAVEEHMRTTSDQQSQLAAILDSMHEGVLVLDPAGRIRGRNKALDGMFPSAAGAEGKPLIEGVPVPALQRAVEAFLERGAGGGGETVHFEWPNGRFLVAGLSRPAQRNETLGAVIVLHDATELMRLERIRRDFVANVSHELRTPLTVVAGYAETMMTSGDLQPEYRNFAEIIRKHAAALDGVLRNMLDLSRIENRYEPVELTRANALDALENALAACKTQAESKNIVFPMTLDTRPVLANIPLLTQVFRNLLENACRYSPAGGQVRIASRMEGKEALFTVSDDGPGIPRKDLPRIFERFYQVKKERNSGTSGIGLAICKHIIERHGGRIWAESPHGNAATAMLFTLPAAPEQQN
jgi:two-component system phosphate regulon sensor histidine kinase PhoR